MVSFVKKLRASEPVWSSAVWSFFLILDKSKGFRTWNNDEQSFIWTLQKRIKINYTVWSLKSHTQYDDVVTARLTKSEALSKNIIEN